MRTAQNPFKSTGKLPDTPDITLAVVTHYTDEPYHAKRMDVVRLCLDSMIAGSAGYNRELAIWDNGSTPAFRDMLRTYEPEVLVESVNVGIASARKGLHALARGETFCFSEDDILFYPGWFGKQLQILESYPNVGLVSGSPQRTAFRWSISANLEFALVHKDECKLSVGRLISDKCEREYCLSVGRDYDRHATDTRNDKDYLLEYNNVKAWAHGHHMQFMARREEIGPMLKPSQALMDNMRAFDDGIDRLGWMRLTTYERTCLHIGNEIDEYTANLAVGMGLRKETEWIAS